MVSINIDCEFSFSALFRINGTKKWMWWLLVAFSLSQLSCKKFLEEKPDKRQRLISSLQDLQALLDSEGAQGEISSGILLVTADEYYITSTQWATREPDDQSNYIWDKDASSRNSWGSSYGYVEYANVVLEALPKVEAIAADSGSYKNIKGSALFYRSFAFYTLAQSYCRPWSSTASTDLGIPLRILPELEVKSVRATVQQTYDQIINDLKEAIDLLPEKALIVFRPNKAAAFGILSRTYLSMRDYVNAERYADSCLKHYSTLMDYNSLDTTLLPFPITRSTNPELIFSTRDSPISIGISSALVDTTIYSSYDNNDLRKAVFFLQNDNGHLFKGDYAGSYNNFCGIATDEMYLTRAECYARAGDKDAAMVDLNTLLSKRWRTGTYVSFTATNSEDALKLILSERKKELLFRGIRWMDLRRFNLEDANITLTRIINGTVYTLPPNDLRWVLLIPKKDVIDLTGMPQNPR